jgi:hypothetical protein
MLINTLALTFLVDKSISLSTSSLTVGEERFMACLVLSPGGSVELFRERFGISFV